MPKASIDRRPPAPVPQPVAADAPAEYLQLRPDDIDPDPAAQVRTQQDPRIEQELIEALAKAIWDQGQLQPIVVRRSETPNRFRVIAGNRRLAAIRRIIEVSQLDYHVQAVVVEKDDNEAWDAAFGENFRRRNFSPIELAKNIEALRGRHGWTGDDWTKHVSAYMNVSRATVLGYSKLLQLSKPIQAAIHTKAISESAGLDLAAHEEARRKAIAAGQNGGEMETADQIVERARSKQQAEDAAKPPPARPQKKPPKGNEEAEHAIKRKHVLAAVRESESAVVKARTRAEILAFFAEDSEDDLVPEPVRKFCSALTDKWAKGQLSDKALRSKWDALVTYAGMGVEAEA